MNRPNHIENYLSQLHTGQWFGWSDSKNKVYANLIIHDDSKDKPTEEECNNGLATMQSDFDNRINNRTSPNIKIKSTTSALVKEEANTI